MRLSWCKDACFALLFSMIMTAHSLMTTVSSLAYQARLRRDVMTLSAKIALTREVGGNDKLAKLLDGYSVYEIPCIMFASGDDSAKLPQAMSDHDVIVITSPQAAKVFLESWIIAGRPSGLNIATVGEGSSRPLITEGLIPFFEPSDSTAKTLAAEIPDIHGKKVLYPSSAIAENTLVEGLEERGFTVTRLSTYTTVPAIWSEQDISLAKSMDIVTFASPSAVKIWSEKIGTNFIAVVIGPSSAKAAISQNFKLTVSPEGSKGIGAWAEKIIQTAKEFNKVEN